MALLDLLMSFHFRTLEFLALLNVDLTNGGESWETQLQPVLTFVQNVQEDPVFLDWLRFLAR